MSEQYEQPKNVFWAVLLIGLGALFLLANLEIISPVNLLVLLQLWPLILIGAGAKILLGRERQGLSNLISVFLVLAAIAALVFAPKLGFKVNPGEMITESFSEPRGNLSSAAVKIELDHGSLKMASLSGSDNLININAVHNQNSSFKVTGKDNKSVKFELHTIEGFSDFFNFFNLVDNQTNRIDVGLAGGVPISLDVTVGSGSADLDLTHLDLEKLDAAAGSGSVKINLPSGEFPIDLASGSGTVTVNAAKSSILDLETAIGSGRVQVNLAENTSGRINIDMGSGTITVTVLEGIGIKVSGTTMSGSVRVPAGFTHSGGNQQFGSAKSGTWKSPGYDQAEFQIEIEFGAGSGTITIIQN
ncbi:MAG: DUF4097 domain-containing protein [Anaerolineae bacterium]|nr:DUF4097 domain-containing protein [Anaerolineae bacterium]